MRGNLAGIDLTPLGSCVDDLAGFDMTRFLAQLTPADTIAARHTVGLVDVIGGHPAQVGDGLPESLEEVVATYGHRYFKLKVGGDLDADLARLIEIAAVLDRAAEPYFVSLDGNEQYNDIAALLELWRRMQDAPQLQRLVASILFIEQPITRAHALDNDVSALSRVKPVIIDESDDELGAFPRARGLGYAGVSSKCCKGLYKSVLNAARCAHWNAEAGLPRYFMTGEDLTTQAGLAVQQDLALVNLIGIRHVERNGHHYVNGMAGLPEAEQAMFLAAHPDLYEHKYGAVRLKIRAGLLDIGSLAGPGFASGAYPDWEKLKPMSLRLCSVCTHEMRKKDPLFPETDDEHWIFDVRFVPILLQKSFWGDERNFLGPLMRFVCGDVRDLIVSHKNDHGPSHRRYRRCSGRGV